MHAIERELIKASGYKAGRKFDNRQDYLGSLLNAVLKLSDDDFDLLTDEAAAWCNAAVEAKNDKGSELPDFDDDVGEEEPEGIEPEAAEDEAEAEDASDEPEDGEAEDGEAEEATDHQDQHEPADEPEARPAKKGAAKAPAKKAETPKAPAKPKPNRRPKAEEDVVLDKWGCMVGSKNANALAMFEKGATTKEVKDASEGATFYNILKKMEQAGHKLVKEGSMIRLTHKDDAGKAAKPAAAKPAAKAKAKK